MTVTQATDVIALGGYRSAHGAEATVSAPEPNAEGAALPSADDREKLRAYLAKLRHTTDGAQFVMPTSGTRKAHQLGVAQWQVAELLGLATRNYRRLEYGLQPWSAQRVEQIVRAFHLGEKERAALYRLALGRSPSPRYDPAHEQFAADFVDDLAHPAHVLDPVFVLVHRNSSHAGWFPELQERDNWAVYLLTNPAARRRFERWQGWAEQVVAELHRRLLGANAVERPVLEEIAEQGCRSSSHVSALWERRLTLTSPSPTVRTIRTPLGPRPVTEWSSAATAHRSVIAAYLPADRAATGRGPDALGILRGAA